jgi:hypothetical protein
VTECQKRASVEDRFPVVPHLRATKPIIAAPPSSPLAELLADAIVAAAPEPVTVVGDDIGLVEALARQGVPVAGADEAQAGPAALAVVHAPDRRIDEVLAKVGADAPRVLLWREGETPVADWVSGAAAAGYFRSADQPRAVNGMTCVLLEAAQPALPELVAGYEALLTGYAELERQLRFLDHQLLTSRDHAIGAEGEIAQLHARHRELEDRIEELLATTTWRVGTTMIGPLGRLKRALRR